MQSNSSVTTRKFDYFIPGGLGQVGRALLKEFSRDAQCVTVVRGQSPQAVDKILEDLLPKAQRPNVWYAMGDLKNCPLPEADTIINAAGCTSLTRTPWSSYWEDNVMVAMRLASYAQASKAKFCQLSSVSVAEFAEGTLLEGTIARPDVRQSRYALSKVLTELVVSAVMPTAKIFRLGDVLPAMESMTAEWRRTHWLSILFRCGRASYNTDHYIHLLPSDELAQAMRLLLADDSMSRCHLFGYSYLLKDVVKWAQGGASLHPDLATQMVEAIRYGFGDATLFNALTNQVLERLGFKWSYLDEAYWREFAKESVRR